MDLFKMHNMPSAAQGDQGEAINGYTSARWTERYREPGDFEIIAPLSSGLQSFLPIGVYISHMETYEMCIVENHHITEEPDQDPIISISGRGAQVILEERIIGVDLARAGPVIAEYNLASDATWNQAVIAANDHMKTPTDADDIFSDIQVMAWVIDPGSTTTEARTLPRADVHTQVMDILAVDDLGFQVWRHNNFLTWGADSRGLIYTGADRSDSVIFSWKGGDLDGAEYFWSDRKRKNAALVVGRYLNTVVDTGPVGYDRRYMIVDAQDLDGHYDAVPTGSTRTTILNRMTTRGRQELQSQNLLEITRADVSNVSNHRYRRDYHLGDMVMVDGNYGRIQPMRVSEYVEIVDENGESGHPSLTLPVEGI